MRTVVRMLVVLVGMLTGAVGAAGAAYRIDPVSLPSAAESRSLIAATVGHDDVGTMSRHDAPTYYEQTIPATPAGWFLRFDDYRLGGVSLDEPAAGEGWNGAAAAARLEASGWSIDTLDVPWTADWPLVAQHPQRRWTLAVTRDTDGGLTVTIARTPQGSYYAAAAAGGLLGLVSGLIFSAMVLARPRVLTGALTVAGLGFVGPAVLLIVIRVVQVAFGGSYARATIAPWDGFTYILTRPGAIIGASCLALAFCLAIGRGRRTGPVRS